MHFSYSPTGSLDNCNPDVNKPDPEKSHLMAIIIAGATVGIALMVGLYTLVMRRRTSRQGYVPIQG
jgi:hypothetical protein